MSYQTISSRAVPLLSLARLADEIALPPPVGRQSNATECMMENTNLSTARTPKPDGFGWIVGGNAKFTEQAKMCLTLFFSDLRQG